MMRRAYLALSVLAVLGGCSTTPEYGCKAPEGVTCKSISEVYRATEGDARRKSPYADEPSKGVSSYQPALAAEQHIALPKLKPGDPVRAEPRILRVWLAPWEDEDEVFYDQSYIYVIVDHGRWLVSQNKNMIANGWRARSLAPPKRRTQPAAEKEPVMSTTQQQLDQPPESSAATRALNDASRNIGGGVR